MSVKIHGNNEGTTIQSWSSVPGGWRQGLQNNAIFISKSRNSKFLIMRRKIENYVKLCNFHFGWKVAQNGVDVTVMLAKFANAEARKTCCGACCINK